jgi:hypothetical protein
MESDPSILLAMSAVNDGLSIRAAGVQFGVAYATLYGRINGAKSREQKHAQLQFLSPGEEEELVKLIHYMASQGTPPTARFIRQFAADLSGRQMKRSWFRGFMRRHKDIEHLEVKKLETSRAAVTSIQIKEFFTELREVIEKYDIDYRDIWNMDETGTHFGESAYRIDVYASKGSKKGRTLTLPENGRLVSSIEAISAEGKTIPSYFVQKGVLFEEHQLPSPEALQTKRFFLARTKGGFSTRETGLNWLTSVFIPFTKTTRGWRLLILDGHVSHTAMPFWQAAFFHQIFILRLPPHATHLLQPLDLEIFGAFKTIYRQLIVDQQLKGFQRISSQTFFDFYFESKDRSFTKGVIKSSFKTAGIWPINASLSLERLPRPVTPPILGENKGDSPSTASPICQLDPVEQAIMNGEKEEALEVYRAFKQAYILSKAENKRLTFVNQTLQTRFEEAKPSKKSKKRLYPDTQDEAMSWQAAAAAQDIDRSSPPEPAKVYEAPTLPPDSDICDSSIVDVQSEPGSL